MPIKLKRKRLSSQLISKETLFLELIKNKSFNHFSYIKRGFMVIISDQSAEKAPTLSPYKNYKYWL